MKNRIRILFIVAAVIIAFTLIACDSLLTPQKARLNPLDAESAIHPAINMTVETMLYEDVWGVSYDWEWAFDDTESTETKGFVIIRKPQSAPETVYDGELVMLFNYTSSVDEFHFENIQDNPDYPRGYKIYYGVFAYAPKWDENDMGADEKISMQDGVLVNTLNYNFVGPSVGTVNIWASKDLGASDDQSMSRPPTLPDTNDGDWEPADSGILNIESATSSEQRISYINFELTDIPSGNIEMAQLVLTKSAVSALSTEIRIEKMNINWHDSSVWDSRLMTTQYDMSHTITESVPTENGAVMNIDITSIFEEWRSNPNTNNGFMLHSNDGSETHQFHSLDSGDTGAHPTLRIWYWNE